MTVALTSLLTGGVLMVVPRCRIGQTDNGDGALAAAESEQAVAMGAAVWAVESNSTRGSGHEVTEQALEPRRAGGVVQVSLRVRARPVGRRLQGATSTI